MNDILDEYHILLDKYGPQGWWPLQGIGYHPGDYTYPKTDQQRFEICIGAILTQNTAWKNVEKALKNLAVFKALHPVKLQELNIIKLKTLIKPAGYYNQKAKKLKIFAEFYLKNSLPTREELLDIWGIGPETADSMLLYGFSQPLFVVDTYTRRTFPEFKLSSYEEIQACFHKALPKDFKIYQEYHALIVEHNKS